MIEDDYFFSCPYCGQDLSVRLDVSGGSRQSFIQDCEVCCSPIQIEIGLKGEEVVSFSAVPAE
jgi:transcription elongation factor Elf1